MFIMFINKCKKPKFLYGNSGLKLTHASYETLYSILAVGFCFENLKFVFFLQFQTLLWFNLASSSGPHTELFAHHLPQWDVGEN